jgi:pimeloyl-ACP methyl ester carboxylesterase
MFLQTDDLARTSYLRPAVAADEAWRQFCRPDLSTHRSPIQPALVRRARVHLAKARWIAVDSPVGHIQAYEFLPEGMPKRTIALVHGWTSEAAFMAAFIEPLRQLGNRIVAFDFPAHGYSARRSASMIDCARAMLAVGERLGPFDAVIAHSIGGLISLLVSEGGAPMPKPMPTPKIVLIGSPNELVLVARSFGDQLQLSPRAQEGFERRLERVGQRPLAQFAAQNLLAARPAETLVIHSRDDDEVDFGHAQRLAEAVPYVRLHAVDGLGHSRVLYAPPVVRVVRDFLSPR